MSQIAKLMRDQRLEEQRKAQFWICQNCVLEHKCVVQWTEMEEARECMGCGKDTKVAAEPKDIAKKCSSTLAFALDVAHTLDERESFTLSEAIGRVIDCEKIVINDAIAALLARSRYSGSDQMSKEDTETFFAPSARYLMRGISYEEVESAEKKWLDMEIQLTHQRRFFNKDVKDFFESLLYEALAGRDSKIKMMAGVAKKLAKNTSLYRARIPENEGMQSKFLKKPSQELGPPPRIAASNGRMSPAGIPLLYTAENPETCVAEVRPSIGDNVVIGEFRTQRTLIILDLPAFAERVEYKRLSIFDVGYRDRLLSQLVLKKIHRNIAKPVRSSDTGYLLTQAFAEFVRYESKEKFDGIAFLSVQNARGINYVLFSNNRSSSDLQKLADFGLILSKNKVYVANVRSVDYTLQGAWPFPKPPFVDQAEGS